MSSTFHQINNFPNYFINQLGQILGPSGKILKGGKGKDGYVLVTLRKGKRNFTRKVHRLVAEQFLTPTDGATQVNHINGIKDCNELSNLEWVSSSENRLHAYNTGLQPKGEQHGRAVLTDEQVTYIRENLIHRHPEFSGAAISKRFGVTRGQVNRIFRGEFR